jgi:hypothetical protein
VDGPEILEQQVFSELRYHLFTIRAYFAAPQNFLMPLTRAIAVRVFIDLQNL